MVIRLLQKNSRQFSLKVIRGKLFCLTTPLTLRRFRSFNFFFKTAVAAFLLRRAGFLLHSSSLSKEEECLIFAGKQESGKSTIIRLVPEYPALNDDFTILRKIDGNYRAFSSPFYETNPVPRSKKEYPVRALYFLTQSKDIKVTKLNRNSALTRIVSLMLNPLSLPQIARKMTPAQKIGITKLLIKQAEDFCYKIPCFMLEFRKDNSFKNLLA